MKSTKKILTLIYLICLILASTTSAIETRIKDITRIEGLEGMELIGYGMVVGLSGTGDKDIELSKRTIANVLESFQITLPVSDVKSKNAAVVFVTAKLGPFHRIGDQVDVQVAALGDSSSLEGGVLLMTPLLNPEGEVYAMAQGALTIGGYSAGVGGAGGQAQTRNYTTVGIIPSGAILKMERTHEVVQNGVFNLLLRQPDYTTACRLADAINRRFEGSATVRDAGRITIRLLDEFVKMGQTPSFISEVERILVEPDTQARVVVNERTGTIVMGSEVHIGEAVVAHGNLTVRIGSVVTTYMPQPFTTAGAVTNQQVSTDVKEDNAKIMLLPGTATVRQLADMLNQMGCTPRDLISILEALRRVGALQMEIVTM